MSEQRQRAARAKPAAVTVVAAPESAPARERVLPVVVTVLASLLAFRTLGDFDTWWHLAAGRWIVTHAAVPRTDTLSYTVTDHAWINVQWLYDVILYGLYQLGGANLLVLAATMCFALAVWIAVRGAAMFAGPVVASVVGVTMVLVAEERFLIRPEMVSFILLGLVLRLLLTAREDGGRRLRLLPILFLLWANLHSLFIVGFACIACFVAGALLARAGLLPRAWREASDPGPEATRRLLIFGAASFAAAFLNPFFAKGVFFPLELFSRIDGSRAVFQSIGEFRSPFSGYFTTWSIGVYQAFFFAALLIGVLAAAVSFRRPPPGERSGTHGFDIGAAMLFCALAYLSVLARRNIGLFVFASTPILGAWIATIGSRTGLTRALHGSAGRTLIMGVTFAVVIACAGLATAVVTNAYYRASGVTTEFGMGVFDANFPERAAQFSREIGLPPKLYNDLTAGGYLTWSPAVDGGVFIDGRLEVYDAEFFTKYWNALADIGAWSRQADAFGVGTVVLFHRWPNRHGLIRSLANDPHWALVYYDDVAVMFVRRAGNADVIARAAAAFPEWDVQTRAHLNADPHGLGYPIARATALDSYARLQMTLGLADRALEAWTKLLSLDVLTPALEVGVRYNVAWLLASKGERSSALLQAQAAAELDPKNADVQRLLERLKR